MYLYLRADLAPDDLPEALTRRVGALTEVMQAIEQATHQEQLDDLAADLLDMLFELD